MFNRWHPQLALRYLPIVRYIKNSGLVNPSILEVGSGSLGIGPYLKKEFTGADIEFSGPKWPQMKQVKASAKTLPFADNIFDIVISVDTLEHIPPPSRQLVVNEIIRTATKQVIIAVPVGKNSQAQDRDLNQEYIRRYGKSFTFLTEHVTYGLPENQAVSGWINAAAKKYHKNIRITQIGNRNLSLRLWLMRGWMTKNQLIDIFFRKILLFFLPILQFLDHRPPYYRQVYFVKISP